MADKKISQLNAASTPLAGTEVLPIVQSGSTVKVSSDNLTVKNVRSNSTTGILQITGPAAASTRVMTIPDSNFTVARTDAAQTFTGAQTFQRITGDFTDAVATNRAAFQTNVTDGATLLTVLPNGTSPTSGIFFEGDSAQTNGAVLTITCGANSNTEARFNSNIRGTGTYLPFTFLTSGIERLRIAETTGNVTVGTGNLIVGTAAKGLDFSANTGAAGKTSSLLNWYEEGTWTPDLKFGGASTGITYASRSGTYTRMGRVVIARASISLSSNGSASGGATVSGLPFNAAVTTAASIYQDGISYTGSLNVAVEGTVDRFTIQQVSEAGANSNLDRTSFSNTANFFLTVCYQV